MDYPFIDGGVTAAKGFTAAYAITAPSGIWL